MTPVGKKRFARVVIQSGASFNVEGGVLMAEFLPLDFGAPRELLTEDDIIRQLKENELASVREPDDEERIALRALRSKSLSEKSARSQHQREANERGAR
jgi:hypothetical protein